ncbi:cyclin-T1-3-like protein isoform X1 [Tanacetum coccineum]
MAAFLSNDQMHSGMHECGTYKQSGSTIVESSDRMYFSRKEIEEKSPSRSDGIDLKKETYLRKSYCTFLQDLKMRLKGLGNVGSWVVQLIHEGGPKVVFGNGIHIPPLNG